MFTTFTKKYPRPIVSFGSHEVDAQSASISPYNLSCDLQGFPQLGVKIKWPNDLFLNGLKVGGVLCTSTYKSKKFNISVGKCHQMEVFYFHSFPYYGLPFQLYYYHISRIPCCHSLIHVIFCMPIYDFNMLSSPFRDRLKCR